MKFKRTHTCGDLCRKNVGEKVNLSGWVTTRRDHGGLIFIDLLDRYGLTQVVFSPERASHTHKIAEGLRPGFVIGVAGEVGARPDGTVNPNLDTGEIEIQVDDVEVLNESKTPPFELTDDTDVSQELRLKYRYLDLRRRPMQKRLIFRHKVAQAMREFLDRQGFIEVETPFLTKSTPEGARDYLVPSRVNPGAFYALPQSPQLFKQILMVAGMDKYFQIVRCFRDEDLRADRQPEFTQLDMEMSFVDESDIIGVTEDVLSHIMREVRGVEVVTPFPTMSYDEAMDCYGTDAPDVRFEMTLRDVSDIAQQGEFKVFKGAVESGGCVKGICAKSAQFSRKEIDELGEFVKDFGAKGLAWFRVEDEGLASPIAKFFPTELQCDIRDRMSAGPGDLLFFVADKAAVVAQSLAALRNHLARKLGLIDKDVFSFVWVVDFPLMKYDDEAQRYESLHHPFTSPVPEDIPLLESDPGKARARAYDVVLNGSEIGGGSIRIHEGAVQEQIFSLLGIDEASARKKFGFLLDALQYGAPPHGGIALGFDRLVSIMLGLDNIRDIIAFPKTQKATCLMTEAPSEVDNRQLRELGLL